MQHGVLFHPDGNKYNHSDHRAAKKRFSYHRHDILFRDFQVRYGDRTLVLAFDGFHPGRPVTVLW
jgi:hypothetical protein